MTHGPSGVDPEKPYRRLGLNSWQETLDEVNESLRNPPNGCDPLDEIEPPDECHVWSKDDIREVQEAMQATGDGCVTFEDPIEDIWSETIIDEIWDQVSEMWCDCEDETCCRPCLNALEGDLRVFAGTFYIRWGCYTPCTIQLDNNQQCISRACFGACIIGAGGWLPVDHDYGDELEEACDREHFAETRQQNLDLQEAELIVAEAYLAALEEQRENCPEGEEGDQCRADLDEAIGWAQDNIDWIEIAIAQLEALIVEALEEAAEHRENADTARANYNHNTTILKQCVSSCYGPACVIGGVDLIPDESPLGSAECDPLDCDIDLEQCCGGNCSQRCTGSFYLDLIGGSNTHISGQVDEDGFNRLELGGLLCSCYSQYACCCGGDAPFGGGGTCHPKFCTADASGTDNLCPWPPGSPGETISLDIVYSGPPVFDPFDCDEGGPCNESEEE